MDAAATPWRATCSAAAATCGASGQAHFPHLLCTSPSSELGAGSPTLGACLCARAGAHARVFVCVHTRAIFRSGARVILRTHVFFARVYFCARAGDE